MRTHLVSLGVFLLTSTCLAQASTWVKVTTKNTPTGRWSHGNSFDFVRGQTVVFGGTSAGNSFMDDTWTYDGKDWTQRQPANKPSGRRLHAMVYHFARVNTVLFGGTPGGTTYLNDTWTWDGTNWTKMTPKNSPAPRFAMVMAYDSARQRTVLFGGYNGSYFGDTWEWDGADWKQIKTANAPSARYSSTMVYDTARKRMVLFGGYAGAAPGVQDTWEYDGTNWTKMNPTTQPSARCCVCMAYDESRKRTVLFGGWNGYWQETWEYDGTNWTRMTPTTQPPGLYDFDLMVYDRRRNRIVLFGGLLRSGTPRQSNQTWEYTATPPLTGSPSTISIASGGAHNFALDAGATHANRLYWIFGSVTGTSPGVTLASASGSVNIPLNPDFYTDITIALANSPLLTRTRGALDGSGKGSATFNVPKITNQSAIGVKFYHAFLVYDAQGNFYMASNAVDVTLAK